jgi:hypothetical protein
MTDETLRDVLNGIEAQELPLLSWGVSDGALSEAELQELVQRLAPDEDLDTVIDDLLDRGMLVTSGLSEPRYRSRMAETVRLATRLRQWFHGRPWATAPSLVSDARFLSRPRTVPRRHIDAADIAAQLQDQPDLVWTDRHESVMNAIIAGRTISAFQARAMRRLASSATGPRGTVISAGTGSGKTLAFYLPALTRVIAAPQPTGVPRIIAIYPRIELLRDQLRTLLLTFRSLAQRGEEVPNVGVLYGGVPRDRGDASRNRKRGWKQVATGLSCPIIHCLNDGCRGTLVWLEASGNAETLTCERCGSVIGPQQLTFTRNRLRAQPPTILFTTTEMVNRELGSKYLRRLLTGEGDRSPEFILLDEIHTYGGTHGAQVANLLRRWRAEMAVAPHVVGLSATLADPSGFFAELTGLSTTSIAVVTPDASEMDEIGREYFLALRGDPASRTSLLSTTIQASMLMRRMLDPSPDGPSGGVFGSKLFVFLDDLDDTNRLYSQLEDAEGWHPGGVNRRPNGSLATLRASTGADVRARDVSGQVWALAEELGTLQRPVRISRTTSRDGGVDPTAETIVATASLEVGFDDPAVGAVIQHKAPRQAAQFIQRRGRAGRDPTMRPWTVVVLSDFGRDRLAFQSYETLFEPLLPPVRLPLRNRTILKMQATWWLLDYLTRSGPGTSLLSVIERPWRPDDRKRQREQAEEYLIKVRGLLSTAAIDIVARQLQRALSMHDEDVRAVLWDHPRALIPAVLATLARRLEVAASTRVGANEQWPTPLAEFVPPNLFSLLQTPEIQLTNPMQVDEVESEPVSQGMRQFAPGRVSYRYARNGRRDRLWVEPPPSNAPTLALEAFCHEYTELGPPPQDGVTRLVQPRRIQLSTPPGATSDSSYGRWNWLVAFGYDGVPLTLEMPIGTAWTDVIRSFQALTHRHRCAQTTWRYSCSFAIERNSRTEPPLTDHSVTLDGDPVGVGFAMDVDALVIHVALPATVPADPALLRSLRVARMEYLIRNSPVLTELVPSVFTREWLHQVLLSALVIGSGDQPIQDTIAALSDDQLRDRMIAGAREVFGAVDVGADPNAGGAVPDPGLVVDLSAVLALPGVLGELREGAASLWGYPNDEWQSWLDERYLTTLASALVEAIQSSCPDVDTAELLCDLVYSAATDSHVQAAIHLSEDQPGGLGVIESFVDRYVEDPRVFWTLVEAALGACDGERVDSTVRGFLSRAGDPPISSHVRAIRAAGDLASLTDGWRRLRTSLFELGLYCDQAIVSALSTRILRPGSSEQLEVLATDLLDRWDATEALLGIDVELRVFAYLAASDPDIRRRVQAAAFGQAGEPAWEIGQIVGVLWPRGYRLRSAALQTYSPYRHYEPTERLLFAETIQPSGAFVDATGPEWRAETDTALRAAASATIRAPSEAAAAAVVRELITNPTSVDVLELHPRVLGVSRSPGGFEIRCELREARQ